MQMMLPGASDVIQHGALFLDFFHFFEYIFSFPCKKKVLARKCTFQQNKHVKDALILNIIMLLPNFF